MNDERQEMLVEQRAIPLEGSCNCRDLGGLETRDGRRVRSGMILRSDELSRLSDADLQVLHAIPLQTIVDLRIAGEIDRRPDRKPDSVRRMIRLSLDTPRWLTSIAEAEDKTTLGKIDDRAGSMLGKTDARISALPEERIRAAVMQLYERLVAEKDCIEAYKEIFALLLQQREESLLFHCAAGKDRTGIVAALILAALDVDEAVILEDYLISNVVAEKKYAMQIELVPSSRYLYEARPEYLQAAWKRIRRDHGTVETYLRHALKVDMDGMKERFLR